MKIVKTISLALAAVGFAVSASCGSSASSAPAQQDSVPPTYTEPAK